MQEWGVWSETEDGFVEAGCWSLEEAQGRTEALVEPGDPTDDLRPRAICSYHEEQPADGCEDCDEE